MKIFRMDENIRLNVPTDKGFGRFIEYFDMKEGERFIRIDVPYHVDEDVYCWTAAEKSPDKDADEDVCNRLIEKVNSYED